MVRPMLGDLELEQVQLVETDEDQVVVRHPVPALEGDFLQDLGRRGARLSLTGVLTKPDVQDNLKDLRAAFHAGDPVAFVSDISSATLVDQVLIERMDVRELAGRDSAYEYHLTLRELTEAEPIRDEPIIIPPPPPVEVEDGKLAVTVVVEGDPAFDMDRVRVSVDGTQDDGPVMRDRVLTNRVRPDTWFEDPFPAGNFTATALVDDNATPTGQHEVLTGTAGVVVREGETASATIVLRRGSKIGTVFVITFHFDAAFVEPCERHVLQQVREYATAHPDEKMLIVGNTDLVGSDEYNQALSERRGRATYAMMTFGSEPEKSVAEWNELRKARPSGTITTVRDTWGTREIQHMLQDLGRFTGNVGKDASLTDEAIRQFQTDHGLTPDGVVGDDTWPVLIREYLAHEAIDFPTAQLMADKNAAGCDNGPLRWIGVGEQDPVKNIPTAWRPNRRTELMFVKEDSFPCQVPEPVTLALVPEGAGGGGWCLNDGTATSRDCFVTPYGQPCPSNAPGTTGPAPADRTWCRTPAEPGSFPVAGRITFDDGTPFAQGSYVLMSPDGEYLNGEIPTTGVEHAGTPIQGRTAADGSFTFPPPGAPQKGRGTYVVSVDGPFLARSRSQPLADVRGNATCFRLDGSAAADIVIVDRAVGSIVPQITGELDAPVVPPAVALPPVGPAVVVVKKVHTNPARKAVVLRSSALFTGTGEFTRSSDRVRFFDAAAGGAEVLFTGVDNVFGSARLVLGVTLFAEGRAASAAVGDVVLTLALTVGGTRGLAATHAMTAVEVFLDLHQSRTAVGAAPVPLTEAAKITPGRFIQVQDAGNHAGRAMVTVRKAVPAGFPGALVLTSLSPRTRFFGAVDEVAAGGQTVLPSPVRLPNAAIAATGTQIWVEGTGVSGALRDASLQLGVETVEPDGDRAVLTVVQLSNLRATVPGTPARTNRLANSPVAAHVVVVGAVPAPADFEQDPTVNLPLPLVENSILPGTPITLAVTVAPVGVPVLWGAQRARGLTAAAGGDDAAGIVALGGPRLAPTVTRTGALTATMLTDNVGTFHVRPFVDGNGNGRFDHGIDREPNLVLNVVLGRATLFLDSSVAVATNFAVNPVAGGGIRVRSGVFNIGAPGTAAIHMNAQIDVVTGGTNGRRAIDQFFGGWANNIQGPTTFSPTYTDPTTAPPTAHPAPDVFVSNRAAATGPNGAFVPADPAPAIVAPPILDTGRGAPGSGGDSLALGQSRIRTPRTNRPLGERWIVEAVDSPGSGADGTHPVVAAARLTSFQIRIRFDCTLMVWTNRARSSAPTGAPADRLYAADERLVWQLDGTWGVTPATGAIAVVAAPATVISARVPSSPAISAVTSGVEVRPPSAVPLLAQDARA
ncbi:peptidoglycan-binding protein [Pengzhenrongella phosphoraccumulans]|uniref:peptidoglycan-binding protein n=1 Tax=Pengzhenrongella phosphoraccumulans TaxID=3114394 RepID=UPI003890E91C